MFENDAIVITGAEKFIDSEGIGKSFKLMGIHKDQGNNEKPQKIN